MSGFQIPGLGQAKPNETLPPLPVDMLIAAASAEGTEDMIDAPPHATVETTEMTDAPPPVSSKQTQNGVTQDANPTETQPAAAEPDSMAIDQPESPPSLTGALEAALGLEDSTPAQPETNLQPAPLQNDEAENPQWEIDSSPYESSSESSSSDDTSDEDSDNEGYELMGVEETARLLMQAEGGSDDEGEKGGKGGSSAQVRTKNEVLEETVVKPDVTITPEMKIEELGAIEHIVESIMLVKANTTGEYQVLDSGSVLCTAERAVIGAVGETIGKVLQPLYTVRFSSEDEITALGLEVGTKVFYPVDHASFVFTEPLKGLKGSDASNLHDEEIGDDEMEFSDDEKEAEHKRAVKQKKKDKWKNGKGAAAGKEPHPLRQETRPDGGLNYDDDEDGPYKPLARPPGYGAGPVSNESYEPAGGRSFQRGRRGDARGRGGRGRGGRGGRGGFGQARDGYSMPPQGAQQQQQTPQAPQWGGHQAPAQGGAAPAMPNFGFQFPGWPAPNTNAAPGPSAAAAPPPPPGWPAQGQQANPGGAFVNPAFFAALMSQMQAQNGQSPWTPPQPPHGQGQ
ncbi:Gar1/Naf1 RNA binding region-domain-containing protein [Dactylonectria macrodidyma]|uniref:H/ACA ribonucleoprotein complex non-core subunit NAF1 n=1 Tax=Dactylonectria macrodidyma TaxID=307937 RepID=A0A9P9E898_9HYPO|nr:Gar1/Naf1 RNA binding region-domain-containing protein [Dactylonectria macrodidyma]